jgi:hypothetical protein
MKEKYFLALLRVYFCRRMDIACLAIRNSAKINIFYRILNDKQYE